jgi:DNA-binding XRE family transcriptional regulator
VTISMTRPIVESATDSVQINKSYGPRVPPMFMIALGAATATSAVLGLSGSFDLLSFQGTAISSNPTGSAAPHRTPAALSTEGLVRRMREASGLTWEQIARVFGVSRRAVHHWAAGESMSAHNLELLSRFDRLVQSLPGSTPEEKRAALFASDEDGWSPVDAFRQMASSSGVIANPRVATHAALLGAE